MNEKQFEKWVRNHLGGRQLTKPERALIAKFEDNYAPTQNNAALVAIELSDRTNNHKGEL